MATPNTSLNAAAASALLPRVKIGTVGELVDLANNKCQAGSFDEASDCLLRETVGKNPTTAKTMAYVQSAGTNAAALAGCATAVLPDDQRRHLECFTNSKDTKGFASCASRDVLPANTQKIIGCAARVSGASSVPDAMKCMGVTTGSREADCLLNHTDSWADAAICVGGAKIPPQVQDAVKCAQTSNDLTGYGVCMVAKQGSGEAQRIAACYAEGQGIPAAVAVCLASDKLTQDQRIVLECAAETNGAPHATAVCAVGKMAAKEMINCKGKKYGDGNCFNENNEIRKFFAGVGVPIGPNSVAAQIINIQLQMNQVTLGPMLDEANKAFPGLLNFAQHVGIVPNPNEPGKMATKTAFGPVVGPVVDEACKHETHLRRILKSYADYNNGVRTHRSLNKDAPVSRPIQRTGSIKSHAILGGLHHHYVRV